MHPKIERLAELADAAGADEDSALRAHVETCAACQAEVSQLHRLAAAGNGRCVVSLPEHADHVTDEEIIGYVNTTLSADKHLLVKQHLHGCGGCMKEVLLYRSHIAQARLPQGPAAVDNIEGAKSWHEKIGLWIRGFNFRPLKILWMGMASVAAVTAILVNPLWLVEHEPPAIGIAQTSGINISIPDATTGHENPAAVTAPENSIENSIVPGQIQDDAKPGGVVAPRREKSEVAKIAGRTPPPASVTPLERFHGESAVAVVIGNKSYPAGGLVDAKYALQDALSVKTWLVSTLGVAENNIIYLENATNAQFNEVFGSTDNPAGKLAAAVKPSVSDVFIYYSGHGAPDLGSKRGYFVPVDADPGFIALSGYAADTLFKNISQLPARSVTVVLDTNFSGNSADGPLLKNVSPALVKTEQPVPRLDNVTVFSGADQGQVNAWDNGQAHSLFTSLFLKGLEGKADVNHDGTISALELQKYLQQAVPYEARRLGGAEQTPVLTQIQDRVLVNLR